MEMLLFVNLFYNLKRSGNVKYIMHVKMSFFVDKAETGNQASMDAAI